MKKCIYCSGPLFCPEEISGMNAIARTLEREGFETFLPHRDGIERFVMGLVNTPLNTNIMGAREKLDRAIFSLDVYQLSKKCHCLVLNLNGRVPDEGAVAEAGIAFAVGRPLIIYKNDARTIFKGRDNSMITGLSDYPQVKQLKSLPDAVRTATATAYEPNLQGRLSESVRYGERIWSVLCRFANKGMIDRDMDYLINEIIELSER